MQPHEQVDFIKAIGEFVIEQTVRATAPLLIRIEQLEKYIGDLPVPVDGKDGRDGKDVDPQTLLELHSTIEKNSGLLEELPDLVKDWTRDYVQGALSALPVPKDGAQGEPGKDGADGLNGADGKSLQLDDVRDHLAELVREAVAELPVPRHCVGGYIDRNGFLSLSFSDGGIVSLGKVVGEDGKDCDMEKVAEQLEKHMEMTFDSCMEQLEKFLAEMPKPRDGVDGLGIENLEYDGVRTFTMSNGIISKSFVIPFPLYFELWKEGVTYQRGDIVTRDGSMFICTAGDVMLGKTDKMPGTADSGWRLAVKRGRDGKDGKEGKQGPEGKPGRDGRDLTQIGPDGSKWG